MLHRFAFVIALAFALVLKGGAADEDKADPKNDKADSKTETKSLKDAPEAPKSKEKWTAVGGLVGTLKTMNGDSWTISVEYQEMQNDQKAKAKDTRISQKIQQQMANVKRQLAAANRIRNPAQRAARIQQIMASAEVRAMQASAGAAPLFKMVTKKKDVDVILAKEVTVRVKEPPVQFDDKGNIKKYTSEELKKLKGPGNYWGYPGDLANMHVGQAVQVYVYKKQVAKKPTTKPTPGKNKDDDAGTDDDDGTDPHVRVVYVLKEGAAAAKAPGK